MSSCASGFLLSAFLPPPPRCPSAGRCWDPEDRGLAVNILGRLICCWLLPPGVNSVRVRRVVCSILFAVDMNI
jgi:hypothetical protein